MTELKVEKEECHFEKLNGNNVLHPCDPLDHFISPEQEPPMDDYGEVLWNNAEKRMKEQGFLNGLKYVRHLDKESDNIVKNRVLLRSYEDQIVISFCPFCGNDLLKGLNENEQDNKSLTDFFSVV